MINRILYPFFLFCLLASSVAFCQTIDANLLELKFSNDGYPERFTKTDNGFYLTVDDEELWFTDGTIDGTRFFAKSTYSGDISLILPLGSTVYFVVEKNNRTDELWLSNGTEVGTIQLTNRNTTFGQDGSIRNILVLGSKVFFSAFDEAHGNELWVSDGTIEGTYLLKDLNEGVESSNPSNFYVFDGNLYFRAYTEEYGTELWKTDGTIEGTQLFKDIDPDDVSSFNNSEGYARLGDNFYFFAGNGETGSELWKSDGTSEGTLLLKDIYQGSSYTSSSYVMQGGEVDGKLLFVANDGLHGEELWETDGTTEGTVLYKDIIEGPQSSFGPYMSELIFSEKKVFFNVNGYNDDNSGLWVSDGTSNGTQFIKDISASNLTFDETGESIFFFGSSTSSYKKPIWKSDGTLEGTYLISEKVTGTNISSHENDIINLNNKVFYAGETERNGIELWVTDGSDAGTSLFYDFDRTYGVSPSLLTAVGDQLFFRGNEYGYFGLCTSDGTIEGTKYLDINLDGQSIKDDSEFIDFNGKLVVSANDGIHGYELWISDGTQEGTNMIKDINPGSASSIYNSYTFTSFLVYYDKLYFLADDSTGRGLWVTDGTEFGTYRITDISISALVGGNGSKVFTGLNEVIYYFGVNNTSGQKGLYKVDLKTFENTFIYPFEAIEHLYSTNETLFIIQDNGEIYHPNSARELWASDGNELGTVFLQKLADYRIDHATIFKNEFYFSARISDTADRALFRSDGTVEGTNTLFVGNIPVTMPLTNNLVACGDYLYFGLENSYGSMRQLWRTDGTLDGTIPIVDYLDDFVHISEKTCFGDNLIFKQSDDSSKIWLTTGNPNEIYGLDINVVNGSSSLRAIYNLTEGEDRVFFEGLEPSSGSELYVAYPLSIASDSNLADSDNDGVVDLFDECPGNLSNMEVNNIGCAQNQLDDDKDGVTNDLDQCPTTLPNETVDQNGCSESDLLDTDGDGIKDSIDLCLQTLIGESVDENGCAQSQLDDDQDGVMNDRDLCPETLPTFTVDPEGCPIVFELPPNNFSIETVGVTCVDKNNGQLLITANENHDYTASVNSDDYNFTTELTIQNLHAGKYELCITITDEPDYIKCFSFEIAEPSEVIGKSSSSNSSQKLLENIEMFSGTAPYTVTVNGSHQLTTMSSSFSVEVKHGDLVQVMSKFPCEGIFERKIEISERVNFAPNPTIDDVYIYLPKDSPPNINVRIYNSSFKLVHSGLFEVTNGTLKVSMESLSSGIYYLKIGNGNGNGNGVALKIVKK